ncbi:MAG: hypothetical protein QQN41_06710 [Nitrosopumilus sp.]
MSPKEILELFDEKFARLQSSTLIRIMIDPGWKLSFDFTSNTQNSDALLPDLEYVESYVLNLRFFIQNNEPCSLRNLSKLYETHCRDQTIKENFIELRKVFNTELDRVWPFRFNKKTLTFRDILMGFIYGKIAHSKVENHQIFHQLTKHPFGYHLALNTFLRCIDFIHDILTMINQLNKKFLAIIEK